MPSLKDKGIALLGSATITLGSNSNGQSLTIFTTPVGKVTRIMFVVFRDPSASLTGGTSYSLTNFVQTFSLANITTANTGYAVIAPIFQITTTSPSQYTEIAAATNFQITVTTGATSAAATAVIDVFGYLT